MKASDLIVVRDYRVVNWVYLTDAGAGLDKIVLPVTFFPDGGTDIITEVKYIPPNKITSGSTSTHSIELVAELISRGILGENTYSILDEGSDRVLAESIAGTYYTPVKEGYFTTSVDLAKINTHYIVALDALGIPIRIPKDFYSQFLMIQDFVLENQAAETVSMPPLVLFSRAAAKYFVKNTTVRPDILRGCLIWNSSVNIPGAF